MGVGCHLWGLTESDTTEATYLFVVTPESFHMTQGFSDRISLSCCPFGACVLWSRLHVVQTWGVATGLPAASLQLCLTL